VDKDTAEVFLFIDVTLEMIKSPFASVESLSVASEQRITCAPAIAIPLLSLTVPLKLTVAAIPQEAITATKPIPVIIRINFLFPLKIFWIIE
jgi:hypothetical protein